MQTNMKKKQFDPQFELLKHQLRTVFVYYCSFGDRDNYTLLKIQNYRRMLIDAQLIENPLDYPQLDIIYAAHRHHGGVDFQSFLAILPEVVTAVSHHDLKTALSNNFNALYEYILESTELGICVRSLKKVNHTQGCFSLLRQLSATLQIIYIYYFDPLCIKATQQAFKSLSTFSRQFQITPHLLTITQSYVIYHYLDNEQAQIAYQQWFQLQKVPLEKQLGYFKFIQYLIVVSSLVGRKIDGIELSPVKKLVSLLELMEVSKGFSKLCRSQKISMHLIPNEQIVKKIDQDPLQVFSNSSPTRFSPSKRQIQPEMDEIFMVNYAQLKRKFVAHCVQGETLGQIYLTHKKAIDIIKAMDLGLKQHEIQLFLSHGGQKHITFESFLTILKKMDEKEGYGLAELVQLFLMTPFHEEFAADQLRTSRIHSRFTRDEYRICLAMVEESQPMLSLVFKMHSEPKKFSEAQLSFISLNSYLKIMHESQLSPLFLSKNSLIEIFGKSIKKSQDFMDCNEFKDSFIIALPYVESLEQKAMDQILILLLQRMNESRALAKAGKMFPEAGKTDYLRDFRIVFKSHYEQKTSRSKGNQSGEDILKTLLS